MNNIHVSRRLSQILFREFSITFPKSLLRRRILAKFLIYDVVGLLGVLLDTEKELEKFSFSR
jgi:hypothetical protein